MYLPCRDEWVRKRWRMSVWGCYILMCSCTLRSSFLFHPPTPKESRALWRNGCSRHILCWIYGRVSRYKRTRPKDVVAALRDSCGCNVGKSQHQNNDWLNFQLIGWRGNVRVYTALKFWTWKWTFGGVPTNQHRRITRLERGHFKTMVSWMQLRIEERQEAYKRGQRISKAI